MTGKETKTCFRSYTAWQYQEEVDWMNKMAAEGWALERTNGFVHHFSRCEPGDEHLVAISHGEGRFVAPQPVLEQLAANGQIATQYIDLDGRPTMDLRYNPNGSMLAIEGITSPDGRILGKMGHSERRGDRLYENVSGDKFQPIFEGGVDYFKI